MPLPTDYPKAYADQEQQLLAQIAARRRAFMQKAGQAEQQYTEKRSSPNGLGDEYNDPGTGDNLFEGDILG
jgi:hypothetical protein